MKARRHEEVEIQITPMLDMAFQLLAFFILTYHPRPTEGQFAMNLLPAAPVAPMKPDEEIQAADQKETDVPTALRTLTTQLFADGRGSLARIVIESNEMKDVEELKGKLRELIDPTKDLPFDQALIQADPNLKYEELIKVVDAFSHPDPKNDKVKISKISFGELNPNAAPGPAPGGSP